MEALIEREAERGVPPSRVVLAGFSQGGAIALAAGLRRSQPLAGLVALSAYLPMIERAASDITEQAIEQPLFMAHGAHDPVVPYAAGEYSAAALRRLGFSVEWHRYPMPHSVCAEEVARPRRVVDAAVHGRLMTHPAAEQARAGEPWLPDLCRLPRLATMFGVAELVVLVLALAPDGGARWNVQRFVSASGFALWLALTIAVLLCASRRQLSRLPIAAGAVTAVLGATVIALLGAAMLYVLDRNLGYGAIPAAVRLWQFATGSAAIAALITAVVLRYLYVIDGWQAQVRASARAAGRRAAGADQAALPVQQHEHHRRPRAPRPGRLPNARCWICPTCSAPRWARAKPIRACARKSTWPSATWRSKPCAWAPRLQVQWDCIEPLPWTLPLPRLVLQPLIENAVVHGVSRLPAGRLRPTSNWRRQATCCSVVVSNRAPPPDGSAGSGARHAQQSIGHRLAYAFGPRARMTAAWHDGYYRCELAVPVSGKAG